jgi:hypothetical protein
MCKPNEVNRTFGTAALLSKRVTTMMNTISGACSTHVFKYPISRRIPLKQLIKAVRVASCVVFANCLSKCCEKSQRLHATRGGVMQFRCAHSARCGTDPLLTRSTAGVSFLTVAGGALVNPCFTVLSGFLSLSSRTEARAGGRIRR